MAKYAATLSQPEETHWPWFAPALLKVKVSGTSKPSFISRAEAVIEV